MDRGRSFGNGDEEGGGAGDAVSPAPSWDAFRVEDEAADDAECVRCGEPAPLNGAELCEECHDEEQRELLECWSEGNA